MLAFKVAVGNASTQPNPALRNKALIQANFIQRTLSVGSIDDPLEREADEFAERISTSTSGCVGKSACSCCECSPNQNRVLRRPSSATSTEHVPPIVYAVLHEPGQPLDRATRDFFEGRSGHNFGAVRVHADQRASESAKAINAQAYTVGQQIVFASDKFAPYSAAGRRLLAHELSHTIQQNRGAPQGLARVPDKGGISKGEYSYSTNCGWIDWGHANPTFAKNLIAKVQQASDDLRSAGTGGSSTAGTTSSPTMAAKKFGVVFSSASMQVSLTRTLSADEVLAVALSIFKNLSFVFEIQQAWTDWFSHSSFSQEDLPSNLISFYRAARGFTTDQIKQFCAAQSTDASLHEFDSRHDFQKNRTFAPIGATGSWPSELSTIDSSKVEALYTVSSVAVGGPASGYSLCPAYRIEGTIDETDLFITSFGGTTFTATDNVRVVPTYRVDTDRVSGYGHEAFIEVKPYSQSDAEAFNRNKVKTPIYVPAHVLVCLELPGRDVTTTLQRKHAVETRDGEDAVPIDVEDVLRESGQRLDPRMLLDLKACAGYDFSDVHVHSSERAIRSARALNALAYTVGRHIVFDSGRYAPNSSSGLKLLGHELGHVIQQTRVPRRQAKGTGQTPAVDKWDKIAADVFGKSSYNDYVSGLTSTTFFGQSIGRIHDDVVPMLKAAEKDLTASQGSTFKPPHADSTLRQRKGMHGWGMAIDFDVLVNPYVLNESGEAQLDRELIVAYDHIADFILGKSQSDLRKLKQGRKAFGAGAITDVYDALRAESNAMTRYFSLKDNDAALTAFINQEWPQKHTGKSPPDPVATKAQIRDDYEVLGGKSTGGAKRPTSSGDRPFAPVSAGGAGDPATGFLNLDRAFVKAMTDAGFAWGAIDIAGEPGDIQHFDLRLQGKGARAYNLLLALK